MAIARKKSRTPRKSIEVILVSKRKKTSTALSLGSIVIFILFGFLFGYFLSKARATDYDAIRDMFLVKEFQLYGVI